MSHCAFELYIQKSKTWPLLIVLLSCCVEQLGFSTLPSSKPFENISSPSEAPTEGDVREPSPQTPAEGNSADSDQEEKTLQDLHRLLLETQVIEGKLVCGNCGHEYRIKEGIANFLLPNHLV